jgi:hypothetical protein
MDVTAELSRRVRGRVEKAGLAAVATGERGRGRGFEGREPIRDDAARRHGVLRDDRVKRLDHARGEGVRVVE